MSKGDEAYFYLFGRVSQSMVLLQGIMDLPDLPVDVIRRAGLLMEDLKDAQTAAEERWIHE